MSSVRTTSNMVSIGRQLRTYRSAAYIMERANGRRRTIIELLMKADHCMNAAVSSAENVQLPSNARTRTHAHKPARARTHPHGVFNVDNFANVLKLSIYCLSANLSMRHATIQGMCKIIMTSAIAIADV